MLYLMKEGRGGEGKNTVFMASFSIHFIFLTSCYIMRAQLRFLSWLLKGKGSSSSPSLMILMSTNLDFF